MRLYVTGTDTGVGKTRVSAALARARADATGHATIVKLVQTGVPPDTPADAQEAGGLAGCPALELHRFWEAADPWSAAVAGGFVPLVAATLAAELAALPGDLVIEGSGGAAVPLNENQSLTDAAALADCDAVLVVGLRLGCISHALLSLEYLAHRGMRVRAAALTEPWGTMTFAYRSQVERALNAKVPATVLLPFDADAARSVARAAAQFSFVR